MQILHRRLLSLAVSVLVFAGCSAQMTVQPTITGAGNPATGTQTPANPASTTPVTTPASTTPAVAVSAGIPQGELLLNMGFERQLGDIGLIEGAEVAGLSKVPDRFGRPAQAMGFSGEGSYLRINGIDINPEVMPKLSMSIWARYTGTNTENSYQLISHDDGQYDRSLGLDLRTGNWGWSMFTGDTEGFILGGAPVQANQWVFLTATYDQQAHKAILYVNGKKFKEGPNNSGTGFNFLVLGANPGYGENFKGEMDDLFLYRRVLSETEVGQLYEFTRTQPQ